MQTLDPPTRMHVHRISPDGTPEWSMPFLRYLEALRPNLRAWERWYENAYVVGRLQARFGIQVMAAVIALEAEQSQPHFIASRFKGVSVTKLERTARRAQRAVRTEFLPYHDRPSW